MQSLYDRALNEIKLKKQKKESGQYNNIPFCFKKYSNYFDGFNPGEYIGLLGMTGSGKSRLLRHWMYHMVDFSMQTEYPLKIVYFALEDPEIPVMRKIMTHYLYTRHNLSISPRTLNSREIPIPEKYLQAIILDKDFYRRFEDIVEVVNDLSSPNQIHKKVAEVYKEFGKTHHILVMVDNQSNISRDPEDNDEWSAIKRLSRDIIRAKFCKNNITTITVLQVDADSEKNVFRNAGKGSLVSIEPNLSSIADAKIVSKVMHQVFGLFDPHRFEIKQYPHAGDYNIDILRNRFKSLITLKSNEEEIPPRLGLLFDGKHEIFEELPSPNEKEALERLYADILKEEREKRERFRPNLLM